MTKTVHDHYRVADLPADLRGSRQADEEVCVTIEPARQKSEKGLSIRELFAMRRPPFKKTEEIVAEIRRQRDEWE